jgi:hypothetical protein
LTVDLDKGDLPFATAFPILMTNAMAQFAGSKGELRESVASGGVTEVEVPASVAKLPKDALVLRSPDGHTLPLPRDSVKAVVGPLDRCGVWNVVAKTDVKDSKTSNPAVLEVACNLASRRESDLRPAEGLKLTTTGLSGAFGGRPAWYYLIAMAWLLAGLEWFLYQRRWIS